MIEVKYSFLQKIIGVKFYSVSSSSIHFFHRTTPFISVFIVPKCLLHYLQKSFSLKKKPKFYVFSTSLCRSRLSKNIERVWNDLKILYSFILLLFKKLERHNIVVQEQASHLLSQHHSGTEFRLVPTQDAVASEGWKMRI